METKAICPICGQELDISEKDNVIRFFCENNHPRGEWGLRADRLEEHNNLRDWFKEFPNRSYKNYP